MKSESNHVYVISGGEFFKIGIARNVKSRLEGLQVGCPLLLKVELSLKTWAYPQAAKLEKEAHYHFSTSRIRGEWFDISILPQAIEFISTHRLAKWGEFQRIAALYHKHQSGFQLVTMVHNAIFSKRPPIEYIMPIDPLKAWEDDPPVSVLIGTCPDMAERVEREWATKRGFCEKWLKDRFPIYQPEHLAPRHYFPAATR